MHLRPVRPDDSFEALTTLLHRAYARHAARGMRFAATHQSVETTRRRASHGECWVGELDGRLVATITIQPPGERRSGCRWYDRPDVAKFGQMAVDPELQGRGLGARLIALAEQRARALGAAELACDTSVHARDLHQLYAHHGFRFVGHADWRPHVNYLSVVLSKDLSGAATGSPPPGWDRAPDDAWKAQPEAVWGVLGRVWPRLPERLGLAERLGFPWPLVSTAFLVEEQAHVGVLEIPALLEGRSVAIAGVHAVGTAPEARGRGLGRRALERALRHVDERWSTAVLTTSIPAYFEPFGFRVVPEHRFRVRVDAGRGPALRKLSADVPEDVELVKRVLDRRTPVSLRLAVEEHGWFFVIDEVLAHGGFGTLYAADDLGVVVAWQRSGGRAELLDVVGPELPPLAEIAARLPADVGEIDLLFCPDRFAADAEVVPGPPDDTVLMVRGEWPVEGPLVMPVHARC